MTTKKKTASGLGKRQKLKLRKETVKDLDAGKGSGVKGGMVARSGICQTLPCTATQLC
jgi:hypothetical protein